MGEFRVLESYTTDKENYHINNLSSHHGKLEKGSTINMKAEAKTNTDTIKSMKRKSSPEDPEVVIESKPYGPKARRIRVPGSDLAPV